MQAAARAEEKCTTMCARAHENLVRKQQGGGLLGLAQQVTGNAPDPSDEGPGSVRRTQAFDQAFRADETGEEKFHRCITECAMKQADKDPEHQKCFQTALSESLAACTRQKCMAQIAKCMLGSCQIDLHPGEVRETEAAV